MAFDGGLDVAALRVFQPLYGDHMYKGAVGGRGSGKSTDRERWIPVEMATKHIRMIAAREVQNSIDDSSKKGIEDAIYSMGLSHLFKITDKEIVCALTDSVCKFRGLQKHTVSGIKSLKGYNRFWIEEAETVSQKSLDDALPSFRGEGAEIWATWNPRRKDAPIERLFDSLSDNPKAVLVRANYYDNPYFWQDKLNVDLMETAKRRDPDAYRHIWLGEYEQRSEARVFHNWKVEEFETPSVVDRFYFGADWGYSVDPTVLVRCFIEGKKLYIDYELHKVGCSIDNTPSFFDSLVPSDIGVARKWPITADSARPETIDYLRRHGYPKIKGAKKGAGSVEDGIEFLKTFDIVVHPRCNHTIDELSKYSWKVDKRTDEVLPMLSDKNNHVIDALRYAVEGSRRSEAPLVRKMSYRGS